MSFREAIKGATLIEALENYSLSDNTITEEARAGSKQEDALTFYSDDDFWTMILRNPEQYWNKKMSFNHAAVSEWIARVPGLYFTSGSRRNRIMGEDDIEM